MADFAYDVFLSHRSVNKPWVEVLAHNLEACGLTVFFDKWSLIPGQSLSRQLHDGIKQSRKALLIATPEALDSGWVNEEYETLLDRRVQQPGYLIPLTFGGEMPDFPFLRNVLTVDFSDPSPAAYGEALHRLLCALRDEPPGKQVNLPIQAQIPDPVLSDPSRADAASLPSEVSHGLHQLLHHNNNMQLLLAQKGIDRSAMQRTILEQGKVLFGDGNCLHASLPPSAKVDERKYLLWLKKQLGLQEPLDDFLDLGFALMDRIKQQGALLLLMTRFDDGPNDLRYELSNLLRSACEDSDGALRVIICGGQKLAQLHFEDRGLSPLKNAEVFFWPDPNVRDLVETHHLDESEAAQLLQVSGSHPALLHALLDQQQHHKGHADTMAEVVREYIHRHPLFSCYRLHSARLLPLLAQDVLAPHDYWPADALMRDLFWDNLITQRGKHFVWRSPIIRACGLEILQG
jgi:hypothetical protein